METHASPEPAAPALDRVASRPNGLRVRVVRCGSIVLYAALLSGLGAFAWRSLNRFSGVTPICDGAVFASVALHVLHGRVLYRDVWDHKPPMVYFLNCLAMSAGDRSINSVRTMERGFAVAGVLATVLCALLSFRRPLLALLIGLGFLLHFYHPAIFEYSNLTEEYGAVFLLAGCAAAIAVRLPRCAHRRVLVFVCGSMLSLAALTKEPFLLSALPWLVYAIWPDRSRPGRFLKSAAVLTAGILLPVAVCVVYFTIHGALGDWIDVIVFNFAYTNLESGGSLTDRLWRNLITVHERVLPISAVICMAAVLGLMSAASRRFNRSCAHLPIVATASFVTSFLATALPGRCYPHYYLQMVPCYILLAGCGLAYLIDLFHRVGIGRIPSACMCLAALTTDVRPLIHFVRRLQAPAAQRWAGDPLTWYVRDHTEPSDRIWSPCMVDPHVYVASGRTSPVKWTYLLDHLFLDTTLSSGEEKRHILRRQLLSNPPKLIILHPLVQDTFAGLQLGDWLLSNYRLIPPAGWTDEQVYQLLRDLPSASRD